ncbi:pectate lyase [Parabacteroides sp. OttesenSCG-928-O15]|nr:pectate lyase [Parabacteroides sp. OttesenSCG-928-O15]
MTKEGQLVGHFLVPEIEGVERVDNIEQLDSATFKITTQFRATQPIDSLRLCLDFVHASKSDYWMIPSVSYNGNHWGKGKEPKGAREAGGWRTFSYRATAIPGATYSEGSHFAIAMWSTVPQNDKEEYACSIMPEEETTTHRLIWPKEEMPVVYAARDRYLPGYRQSKSLEKGDVLTFTTYLCVTPVETNHTAVRTFMKKAWDMSEKPLVKVYSPSRLWDLGIQYAKESLWVEEGSFKGFSIGLTLTKEEIWEQRRGGKYEIGWCGQNASFANSFLYDYLKSGNKESLHKGITTLDTWASHCLLPNGLFIGHFDYVLNKNKEGLIDACNLGTAAINYFEAYDLAEHCKLEKTEYEKVAYNICRFAIQAQQPSGCFAKSWNMDGECVHREGTIGAFMVPPLIEAYKRSGEEEFKTAALKGYDFYVSELYTNGYTTAGALDTWCIDKESSIPLLRSAIMLYKLTQEQQYLNDAVSISYYLSTWLWHYNGYYPVGDNFREYNYQTFGGTSVSVQHHHLDPYALFWVPEWIELTDLTGDQQWKEKAIAIWNNGSQLVSDGTLVINGRLRPVGSQNEAYLESEWNWNSSSHFERINSWLVAWPGAFRLETLRKLGARDSILIQ